MLIMQSHSDLKKLTKARLSTFGLLIKGEDWEMSVYMMALCLELALKARVCRTLNLSEYPYNEGQGKKTKGFFKTHKFDDLALVAGMKHTFSAIDKKGIFRLWNEFHEGIPGENWTDMRYMQDMNLTREKTLEIYKCFIVILKEIIKEW